MTLEKIPFSVLDLVPVTQGNSHLQAIQNSLSLAKTVEYLGYKRFWISEHHNTESLVSSATAVLIGYIAQGTNHIRVGSGGIMLPNHTPLVVAEQFGTLETLYPGRIDLGLGRAPGTDQRTAKALRRERVETVHDFPRDVMELEYYFSDPTDFQHSGTGVRAIPGEGLEVPLYLLGSSLFSAQLAAETGLPYAFASHFAPTHLFEAFQLYRDGFTASKQLKNPYTIAAVNVIIGDTDEEAHFLSGSMKLFILNIIRNTRNPLLPPPKTMDGLWTPVEEAHARHMMHFTFIGSKETVERELKAFVQKTKADELMVITYIYDHQKRLRSYELLSEIDIFQKS
ncbi:MAG TPA: LLM class flavin-dependent oxidoreductase [Flavobacteriaceae bacterium]|nr:LLM class flavin-dependent oxidoreductase [Flavobacteriaceae bacterium]